MSRLKEQKAWDVFKSHTDYNEHLRLWRVENSCCDGMCDVYGLNDFSTSFWIENKALDAWPKRATTLPLRAVFEPGQIPFMKEVRHYGGYSFVLLRVGSDEWYLLNPKNYYKELVDMTRDEIESHAVAVGLGKIIVMLEQLQ
jgi:hypothetical protein